MTSGRRDGALAAYYDNEARAGTRRRLRDFRVDLNDDGVRIAAEIGGTVLDVGAGSGLDAVRFASAGRPVVALDLSFANNSLMRAEGLPAIMGSLADLPVRTGAVGMLWSMSTLVHVDDGGLDRALDEFGRVVRTGGVVVIGSWGGRDWDGLEPENPVGPRRYFCLRGHDRWKAALSRLGTVERFDTFETDQPGWEYQFAVIRRSAGSTG